MRIRFVLLLPRVVCLLDPPSLSMQTPRVVTPACRVHATFLFFVSSMNRCQIPLQTRYARRLTKILPQIMQGPLIGYLHILLGLAPRMQKSRLSQAPRMRKIFSFPPGWLPQTRKLYERSGAGPCLKQANQSISHACKQPIITGLHALSLDGVPGTSQPPPIREPITPVVSSSIRSLEDGKCSRWTLVG